MCVLNSIAVLERKEIICRKEICPDCKDENIITYTMHEFYNKNIFLRKEVNLWCDKGLSLPLVQYGDALIIQADIPLSDIATGVSART